MKIVASNSVCNFILPRPIVISHQRKNRRGTGPGELPKIRGSLFIISGTAKASNFKFGMQLGFAESHLKTYPQEKGGVVLGQALPNIWGFLYYFCNAHDFKFGVHLEFAKYTVN